MFRITANFDRKHAQQRVQIHKSCSLVFIKYDCSGRQKWFLVLISMGNLLGNCCHHVSKHLLWFMNCYHSGKMPDVTSIASVFAKGMIPSAYGAMWNKPNFNLLADISQRWTICAYHLFEKACTASCALVLKNKWHVQIIQFEQRAGQWWKCSFSPCNLTRWAWGYKSADDIWDYNEWYNTMFCSSTMIPSGTLWPHQCIMSKIQTRKSTIYHKNRFKSTHKIINDSVRKGLKERVLAGSSSRHGKGIVNSR